MREQYWIDNTDCVNQVNAYTNEKEYDKSIAIHINKNNMIII